MSDIKALLREAVIVVRRYAREYADIGLANQFEAAIVVRCYAREYADIELANQLEAAAESLGEPVAWLCITDDGNLVDAVVTDAGRGIYELCGRTIQPLYLAPPPAVPEGFVLVPVEPTEAMIDAMQGIIDLHYNPANAAYKYQARHAYSAMLRAALAKARGEV